MTTVIQYQCNHCKKTYKRYSYYSKHIITCCPRLERNDRTIEEIKEPSTIETTLLLLIKSNNVLKEQVKQLQNEAKVIKQKINIIDILNKNKPKTDYIELTNNLIIKFNINNFLEENNFDFIIKNLNIFIETDCLCKVKIKTNKIFGYSNGWKELDNQDIKTIINKIYKLLFNSINNWSHNLGDKLFNENNSDKYIKTVRKIDNIINNNNIINTYKYLYNNIKLNHDIVEYEVL